MLDWKFGRSKVVFRSAGRPKVVGSTVLIAGGEVDFFGGVQAGHGTALIFFADAAQIDAEFEAVRAAEVGEVIDQLPGADHALIAEIVLCRVVHRGGKEGDLVERSGLAEDAGRSGSGRPRVRWSCVEWAWCAS